MQTFNSFDALASSQCASPLVSDMSTFNAATPLQLKSLARVTAESWKKIKEVYDEMDFEGLEGLRIDIGAMLQDMHVTGTKVTGAIGLFKPTEPAK